MTRVKWLLAMLILVLTVGCADQKSGPTAPVADTPENRKAAALRYMEAMPPQEMLENITNNVIQRMPEPTRKKFQEAMADKKLLEEIRRVTQEGLVKHFTADELNSLAAFYGSAAGKSARNKFGPYMADIMPQINQEVRKIFATLQEQPEPVQPQAGKPTPEGPKAGEPKPAQPKVEAPKAVPPKPDQPKAELVKPEPPKPEKAPAEQPKPEQPKSK